MPLCMRRFSGFGRARSTWLACAGGRENSPCSSLTGGRCMAPSCNTFLHEWERMARVLVTGAGGFIGHHLTKALSTKGHTVRGVDLKGPEYEATSAAECWKVDLRCWSNCHK